MAVRQKKQKGQTRLIATSFIAGIGAMALAGCLYSVMADGGVSPTAHAATFAVARPAIEPIDVVAVKAQLAQADVAMQAAHAATDVTVSRLGDIADKN